MWSKKGAAKILKCEDLTIEIQCMWNVKAKVVSVVLTKATATISESLRQYLSNIAGKHKVKELHKTATQGTAHVLRSVLM